MQTKEILQRAKNTVPELRKFSTEDINRALEFMAKELIASTEEILAQNKIDLENAKGRISDVMIDRLSLDESRIKGMAKGILDVAALPSPVGKITERNVRANGLVIEKVTVPMGVIAIIYES